MAYILRYMYNLIRQTFKEADDPRVSHLPLAGSMEPMLATIAVYLFTVLYLGPKWMKHRKPFDLKIIMRVYNAIQVLANLSILLYGLPNSLLHKNFSLQCQGIDSDNREPWMMHLVYATYAYYLTKYLDLLDTVFFILRKKNSQITFLHVYHHAGMVCAVYLHTKFLSGSHSTMLGLVNLVVHTVMYAYYFVTSLRPSAATLWWKRHITQLQLLQFGYLMLHYAQLFVYNPCRHPLLVTFTGWSQNCFMFMLFFDFYYKTYMRKSSSSASSSSLRMDKKKVVGGRLEKCT